jgi:hypothetical protein
VEGLFDNPASPVGEGNLDGTIGCLKVADEAAVCDAAILDRIG